MPRTTEMMKEVKAQAKRFELFDLSGKNAVITGCRTGIGQAMAIALAQAGADIVSFDRREPVETRAAVEEQGSAFTWEKIDFLSANPEELQDAVDRTIQHKQIDILVNNAGINPRGTVADYTYQMWENVIKVNTNTVWYLSQAVSRHMVRQGGGKIIIIGSVLTFQGGLHTPGYTASKHAVAGIAKSMCNELADQNININVIAPGYIKTKLNTSLQDDVERNTSILKRIPTGRWGTPEDLAGTCVFLASSASDYINGAIISVDGGWLSR